MRLFVGIDLPAEIKEQVPYADLPDLRWVAPENLHLTLCFLGEVGQHRLLDLRESLQEAAEDGPGAFDLALRGVGTFLPGSGHGHGHGGSVVWTGVIAGPELARLHARVKKALFEIDLRPERKKFSPHVTLARSKFNEPRGLFEFLRDNEDFATDPFPVPGFELFVSHLRPEGPVYSIEESFALEPRAGGGL